MEGIRSRRYDSLVCFASKRSWPNQIRPTEDHRRKHQLALPQRIEARVESLKPYSGSEDLLYARARASDARLAPECPSAPVLARLQPSMDYRRIMAPAEPMAGTMIASMTRL